MMVKASEKVLKELCHLRNGSIIDWLKECRQDAMERLSNIEDPSLRGEIRCLKELIEKIESARDQLDSAKGKQTDMRKAF